MQPKLEFLSIAEPYCQLINLLAQRSARVEGTLRGVDFYSPSDLRIAVANSLEAFLGGNKFLPSLQSPRTFNEKIFASKFLAPLPIPTLADKLLINRVAAETFGKESVSTIIWHSEDSNGIEDVIRTVPDGTYFFKANHASGANLRLRLQGPDRNQDVLRAKIKANEWLRYNFGFLWGEFHYATFKRKIFLELSLGEGDATDYRFYCFNNKPRLIQVDQNSYSQEGHTRDFFDVEWNLLPILQGYSMSSPSPRRPDDLGKMLEMAEVLATRSAVSFVRVDFFWSANFGVKVAEVTYMPTNGTRMFRPACWNEKIGSWWEFPYVPTA